MIDEAYIEAMARDLHNAMVTGGMIEKPLWGEIAEGYRESLRGLVRMVIGAYMPTATVGPASHVTGDPTVADIARVLGESYKPEGIAIWLHSYREQLSGADGRRSLYDRARGLAEGVMG